MPNGENRYRMPHIDELNLLYARIKNQPPEELKNIFWTSTEHWAIGGATDCADYRAGSHYTAFDNECLGLMIFDTERNMFFVANKDSVLKSEAVEIVDSFNMGAHYDATWSMEVQNDWLDGVVFDSEQRNQKEEK